MRVMLVFAFAVCSSTISAQFSEFPGVHEFSGGMIAKPSEGNLWAASALIPNDTVVQSIGLIYFPLPAGQTENQCHVELMATNLFTYVEPDWLVYPTIEPNDPIFPISWHHTAMESPAGWDINTGSPAVTVTTCDTGIRTIPNTHADLAAFNLEGYNATTQLWCGSAGGGDCEPVHPHGTMTAGVNAVGNNATGVTGVGWSLSRRSIRVSETANGSSTLGVLQHAIRVAAEAGDNCISVSYSGVDMSEANLDTAAYARGLGSLVFWSAGNSSKDMSHRHRDADALMVVSATTEIDAKAGFSSFGTFVDLAAPGVNIQTCTATVGSGSSYTVVSGTSFSAPLTAGVAGVIWSADPTLSPDDVELLLKMGATDLGEPGVDDVFGFGRLSLKGSLDIVGSPTIHTIKAGAGSSAIGGGAVSIPITLSNPEPIMGFTFGLLHDGTSVTVMNFAPGAALAVPPEYWHGTHWASAPFGVTIACIFSLSSPFTVLPPGDDQEIASVGYSAIAGTGSALVFTGALGDPPLAVEVSVAGEARSPLTVSGEIGIGISFRRGDVNGDGSVSISDPVALLLNLFSTGGLQCMDAADVDDNGGLNLADAMYALAYIVTGGPPPLWPFNGCGSDLTDDPIGCAAFGGCP